MMNLPNWLAGATGAKAFAGPSGAPNWGDALQGIGHSLAQNYRNNFTPRTGGPAQTQGSPLADIITKGILGSPPPQVQPQPSVMRPDGNMTGGIMPVTPPLPKQPMPQMDGMNLLQALGLMK
jgi:hypothetical protein